MTIGFWLRKSHALIKIFKLVIYIYVAAVLWAYTRVGLLGSWSHGLSLELFFFKKIYRQNLEANLIIAHDYNSTKKNFIGYKF